MTPDPRRKPAERRRDEPGEPRAEEDMEPGEVEQGAPEMPGREGIHEDRQARAAATEAQQGRGEDAPEAEGEEPSQQVLTAPGGWAEGGEHMGDEDAEDLPKSAGERTVREAERKRKHM